MLKFHSYPSKHCVLSQQMEPLHAIRRLFSHLFVLDAEAVVRIWTHRVIIGAKAADGCYSDDVEIFGAADEMLPVRSVLQSLVTEQGDATTQEPGQPMRFDQGLINWASWMDTEDLRAALELHLEEPDLGLREAIDLAA